MNSRSFLAQRPLVCFSISFGLGILIGGLYGGAPMTFPAAGLVLSAALLFVRWRLHLSTALALCFMMLFFGIFRASAALNPVVPPEGTYRVSASVRGLAEVREDDGRVKASLRNLRLVDEAGKEYYVKAAYWTYFPTEKARLFMDGQTLSMISNLYHPSGRQNPYGFNFRLYLLQKGMGIGLSGARDLTIEGPALGEHASVWIRARLLLGDRLEKAIGEGGVLIRALLLGDRSGLEEETRANFRDAGIAHVLSVSGLHVGLLAFGLYRLLKKAGLGSRRRFAIILAALALYCRLLDFAAPVLRASVMMAVMLGAELVNERADPLTSLALAFLLILLIWPLELFSAGFQLSFLAVLGILTLGDRLTVLYNSRRKGRGRRSTIDRAVSALTAALSASLFTLPVLLNTFHSVSLIGLLVSPIACAAVAILMYCGLFLLPFALISIPAAAVLAVPLRFLLTLFTDAVSRVSSLPFALLWGPAITPPAVALWLAALICMTRYARAGKARLRLLKAGICLALCVGLTWGLLWKDGKRLRYTLLSTGSADAAVIEDGRRTYVIDTADHGGDLAAYLLSKGRSVDVLFLSHLHNDHAGGLRQLLEQGVRIGKIVLPTGAELARREDGSADLLAMAEQEGIPIVHADRGDSFGEGRVKMEVLWPIYGKIYPGMDANHHSLVLRIGMNDLTLLSGGDLSGEYEMYSAVPAHVLKLAHHGAKTGTGEAYLKAVSPKLALLTAGPGRMSAASSVLKRLENMGIPLWGTQSGRALILEADEAGVFQLRHYGDRGI